MIRRSRSSCVRLTARDAAIIKAMRARGDRQHDIASYFGVNQGRISEVCSGRRFSDVTPATGPLPPSGPYSV